MVWGYPSENFPEPINSILVVSKTTLSQAEILFRGEGQTIVMLSRYLEGYIGYTGPQYKCLVEKLQYLEGGIQTLSGVARKHLQAAYTCLQKSLQQEWALMKHTTQGLGEDFKPLEKALWEEFLVDILQRAAEHMPNRTIIVLVFKRAGLEIMDPTQTAKVKWTASCVVVGHLVADRWDRF